MIDERLGGLFEVKSAHRLADLVWSQTRAESQQNWPSSAINNDGSITVTTRWHRLNDAPRFLSEGLLTAIGRVDHHD